MLPHEKKTEQYRHSNGPQLLFLSINALHKPVGSSALSRWLKTVLHVSGIGASTWSFNTFQVLNICKKFVSLHAGNIRCWWLAQGNHIYKILSLRHLKGWSWKKDSIIMLKSAGSDVEMKHGWGNFKLHRNRNLPVSVIWIALFHALRHHFPPKMFNSHPWTDSSCSFNSETPKEWGFHTFPYIVIHLHENGVMFRYTAWALTLAGKFLPLYFFEIALYWFSVILVNTKLIFNSRLQCSSKRELPYLVSCKSRVGIFQLSVDFCQLLVTNWYWRVSIC